MDFNKNNYTSSAQTDEIRQADLLVIKKMAEAIEKQAGNILKEIQFGENESELKTKYYKAFNELPKKEAHTVAEMFSGINIIEKKYIPENVMVWKFDDPKYNKIFFYKEDKLYEMKNPFEYKPSHFVL